MNTCITKYQITLQRYIDYVSLIASF